MADFGGLFALPPGADFPAALVAGLLDRLDGGPPEALARVEIIVNTQRMRRRILAVFAEGPARLLPRIHLVTDLAPGSGSAVSSLRRQLDLSQLIAALLAQTPELAPKSDAFALAESLAALLAEMEDEGVAPAALAGVNVGEMSAHWQRTQAFLDIVDRYQQASAEAGANALLRRAVLARMAAWDAAPPAHPVILAGSTGSRGTTQLLMRAVARLPLGAVVLPGFDFGQPEPVWSRLRDDPLQEDHPQYRFAALLRGLDMPVDRVRRWTADDPEPARNRVVSLALRPAPVTHQWIGEGAGLGDLRHALGGVTLIEAADPRHEALSIALCLRNAAEAGQRAALVTPDRTLARRVTAALDRWRIVPDDSAGRPLSLTAPGRLLRHVASLAGAPAELAPLLALLKHPLTHSGADRGTHLRRTRDLELWLRRKRQPAVGVGMLADWAETVEEDGKAWAAWLIEILAPLAAPGLRPLTDHVRRHRALAERLSAGPGQAGSGGLWLEAAGEVALGQVNALEAEAEAGGTISAGDYLRLIEGLFARAEVRRTAEVDTRIAIWGTLEARVQRADLVVLAGLTDGVWPALPAPDPWLNRQMRRETGLLSPERQIGLSAHDFQQAVAAPEVVLSRSIRDAEAETVMSRWLNRLYNLVRGLPQQNGPDAWAAMAGRGRRWTDLARRLDTGPAGVPAVRPAPRPPLDHRPKQLSITQIQTLIRDPYAIYARHILRLRPLDPLTPRPDPALRGDVFHKVVERFVRDGPDPSSDGAAAAFLEIAADVLARRVPWPGIRLLWEGQLAELAPKFLAAEAARRALSVPVLFEAEGEMAVTDRFRLVGKIDRIDRRQDGRLAIYDYKTGSPPSASQVRLFDRQLMLSALMAEAGAIAALPAAEVAEVAYLALRPSAGETVYPLRGGGDDALDPDVERGQLQSLIAAFETRERGYAARRAMERVRYDGDYDHLARYGEWDVTDTPDGMDVG